MLRAECADFSVRKSGVPFRRAWISLEELIVAATESPSRSAPWAANRV